MNYTIKEMAERFGVTEHTLRFYTDKGLLEESEENLRARYAIILKQCRTWHGHHLLC